MESPCECGIEPPGSISHGVSLLVSIPVPFPHLHAVGQLVVHLPSRIVSHPDLYPLLRPPGRSLALVRRRICIPGFIRSPSKLAVYDVSHSFPLGGLGKDFAFTEDETRRHFSYLSGTFNCLNYLSDYA